jgi:hypothetical protein
MCYYLIKDPKENKRGQGKNEDHDRQYNNRSSVIKKIGI